MGEKCEQKTYANYILIKASNKFYEIKFLFHFLYPSNMIQKKGKVRSTLLKRTGNDLNSWANSFPKAKEVKFHFLY